MKHHLLALLLLVSSSIYAATGTVEGVRMPIWVEQDGVMSALAPGMRLHTTDAVTTGEGGRLLLRLDDGALVRLGENAQLALDDLKSSKGMDSGHIAVSVKKGSFRLKTGGLKKLVNVTAGSLAASGSSMDICGRASDERDAIALMAKGRANVEHDSASHATLTRARTFVDALNGGSLNAVNKVNPKDYASWIAQTDLQSGKGVVTRKGHWKVDLGAFQQRAEAESVRQSVDKEGYAVTLFPANIQDKTYWRPQVLHFKTQHDAVVAAEQLRSIFDTLSITTQSK